MGWPLLQQNLAEVPVPDDRPRELDALSLARAQRRDPAAFRCLVETYHRRVFDLLWRMLARQAGHSRVEELTQETFLRVFTALPRFSPAGPAKLSTWILTVATRLALNERAKSGRTVALQEADGAEAIDDPERAARRSELRALMAEALSCLAPPYRAALLLREYHELSYAEIAEALDVDIGTVKSRLSRARQQVRERLLEVYRD